MNANQLINMVMRMFVNKLVNKGMDAGINAVSKRNGSNEQMSAEQKQSNGQNAKLAKGAMRMMRRVGRF
jgi:hypothetical protein